MKGTLTKTEQGWMVRYLDSEKSHDIMYCGESLPLHPEYQTILPLDLDLNGKEVEFETVNMGFGPDDNVLIYAKLSGSEVRKQTLAFLATQAQQLSMGYESEWDEFFVKSEQVLNFELPLRYKNFLKNTYQKPTKI